MVRPAVRVRSRFQGTLGGGIRDNASMDGKQSEPAPPPLEPEDYYMEGPYMVFTASYHLKRGYCCGSGCRHCPYREKDSDPSE